MIKATLAPIVVLTLALGFSTITAQSASAGYGVSASVAPSCSNRGYQVVYYGTSQVVWRYNNDYHWNGHFYAWSFTGGMLTWYGPPIGWVQTYDNPNYYCP